jgi:uncharacterized protein HemX
MEPVNALFIGLLALAAGGVAWWWHRSRVAALRSELREAQDSRLELAETAATLHRRLSAADQALAATAAINDAEQRRGAMAQALAAAAPAKSGWEDTHPLTVPGFQLTQPAEIEDPRG